MKTELRQLQKRAAMVRVGSGFIDWCLGEYGWNFAEPPQRGSLTLYGIRLLENVLFPPGAWEVVEG